MPPRVFWRQRTEFQNAGRLDHVKSKSSGEKFWVVTGTYPFWGEQNPYLCPILNGEVQIRRLSTSLNALEKAVSTRKEALLARLGREERITDEDAEWLDNEANDVEERALIEELEKASDFERGLGRLDSVKRKLVEKLKQLADGGGKENSEKLRRKQRNERENPAGYRACEECEAEREICRTRHLVNTRRAQLTNIFNTFLFGTWNPRFLVPHTSRKPIAQGLDQQVWVMWNSTVATTRSKGDSEAAGAVE
ncbi:hypothetical protein FB451DRAFT_1196274 [Mycena latifolia]|nr:hypothetical protein FB451DRAFT_1196274 [Mycena latifolia]